MLWRLFCFYGLLSFPLGAVTSWPDIPPRSVPWPDGEKLTYLVSWGLLSAAEGTFTARDHGDHWEFKLELRSRGAVDLIYPFTGTFWSLLTKQPLRSVEFGEWRFEPKRVIKERTRIDYEAHRATREIWSKGETKTYDFPADGMDDIGSMLYNLRAGPWQVGQQRTLYVYEDNSSKQGQVTCTEKISRSFGSWPKQPLLHLHVIPTVGTHHRGYVEIYMTDDARRWPLHADLEFRYGTFAIDLEPVK